MTLGKQDILKTIKKPEDQLLAAKAIDSAFLCIKTGASIFTDFYDPKSVSLIMDCLRKVGGINVVPFGGCCGCERVMLCLTPTGYKEEIKEVDFPIKTLFIDSSKFSSSLTHRDFLGSLIGLGIERTKIGDIFVEDGNATVFVNDVIADFIICSLEKAGRIKVKISECQEGYSIAQKEGKKIKATVPSMRADAVVGEAFNLSRGKASDLIKSEKLFVNWALVTSTSQTLKEGDVISARGFGRAIISTIGGKTKKDRLFIEIERFV